MQYTLRLSVPVLPFLRALSDADRREVRRLLGLIRLDPSPDNLAKHLILVPPVFFTVYSTARFWIVYHVNDNVIVVNHIGRSGLSEPTP